MTLIFILNCVDTQLTALLSIVQAEITPRRIYATSTIHSGDE